MPQRKKPAFSERKGKPAEEGVRQKLCGPIGKRNRSLRSSKRLGRYKVCSKASNRKDGNELYDRPAEPAEDKRGRRAVHRRPRAVLQDGRRQRCLRPGALHPGYRGLL